MKKSIRNTLIFAIILLLGIAIYIIIKPNTKNPGNPAQYDEFAKCLSEKGIKMYGTNWCKYCQKQKDLFGSSFKYINFIDCDKNREECIINEIKGYPTWRINEKNYVGLQTLEKLAELSGCSLNKISNKTEEFVINAFRFGYSPNIIEVNKGDKVIIYINNTDTMHGIRIPDFGVSGNERVEFVADKQGEFEWYCNNICGLGHMQMKGKIIVK